MNRGISGKTAPVRAEAPQENRLVIGAAAVVALLAFSVVVLVVSNTELWKVGWLRHLLWDVFITCACLTFAVCASCVSKNPRFRRMALSCFLKFVLVMFVTTVMIVAYCFLVVGE